MMSETNFYEICKKSRGKKKEGSGLGHSDIRYLQMNNKTGSDKTINIIKMKQESDCMMKWQL